MSDAIQERVRIPFELGTLAGELAYSFTEPTAACLLLCPHPYMGGRMDNPIIKMVAIKLACAGLVTLRFNYRGVGESDGASPDIAASMSEFWACGHAPEDPSMIDDGIHALRWLCKRKDLPLFLIGYSFGAHVATRIMPAQACGMTLISPTIHQHDYSSLMNYEREKLVIASDDDFATSIEETATWYETLPEPKKLICFNGGEHFYRGLEPAVTEACIEFAGRALESEGALSCD